MSKRKEATDIPLEVRLEVWERDDHKCIFCKRYVGVACANAHYIKRSQGGLGIPQNIGTACPLCHREEDAGKNTGLYRELFRKYLSSQYSDWDETKLYYKKGMDLDERLQN